MAAGLPANSPSRNPSGAAAAKQEASVKPGFQPSAAAQSTASATSSGSMVRTRNEPSFIKVRTQVDQCHATNKQLRFRINSYVPLLQLFDLPSGLVIYDNGLPTADRVVKRHLTVANRSRDTFIFPRTTHQVGRIVIEGREYVVSIFVSVNATPVGVTCPFHQAPGIEAANRLVMERAFSFDIAGDSSLVNDSPPYRLRYRILPPRYLHSMS